MRDACGKSDPGETPQSEERGRGGSRIARGKRAYFRFLNSKTHKHNKGEVYLKNDIFFPYFGNRPS